MKFGGSSGRADAPDAPTHETHPDGAQRLATTDTAGGGHSEKGKAREPLVVVTEASATPARRKKLSPGRNQPPASGASPKPGGLRPSRPTFSDPGDGYDSAIRWHADFERGTI